MKRILGVIILITILIPVGFHTFISGWQPYREIENSQRAVYGVVYNPQDNLSYCAWAQQTKNGIYPVGSLYTTTEHKRLHLSPFFFAVGRLAALLSISPLAVLNLLGILSIPVFILGVWRLCRRLAFSHTTAIIAVCLALGGGGVSWIPNMLNRGSLGKLLQVSIKYSPDLYYFDLYPISAFAAYPYHSVSLAILSVLCLMIVSSESFERRLSMQRIILLIALSLCLASVRPYEPVMILVTYSLTVIVSYALHLPSAIRRRRAAILLCLACGILPLTVHSLWVTYQPVWSNFTSMSLNLVRPAYWGTAFLILWILAAVGVLTVRDRLITPGIAFLTAWAVAAAAILVVLHSGLSKLCGGCTIPLGILAGLGVHHLQGRIHRKRARQVLALCLIAVSVASPLVAVSWFARDPVTLDLDLFHAVREIQEDAGDRFPTVLTDAQAGMVLPGLSGFRVYCGHWSLTDNYFQKTRVLEKLGLPADMEVDRQVIDPANLRRSATALVDELEGEKFHYLLARNDAPLALSLNHIPDDSSLIYSGDRYVVIRMDRSIILQLQDRLRAVLF